MSEISEEKLSKLAEEAILNETRRAALRAEMAGPSGWLKPKLQSTNKLFLKNTIKGALISNRVQDKKIRRNKERNLDAYEKHLKEQKRYKRIYIRASTKNSEKKVENLTNNIEVIREDKKIKNDKFSNEVIWEDDGPLQISCFKTKRKKSDQKLLQTNNLGLHKKITFISGSENNKL